MFDSFRPDPAPPLILASASPRRRQLMAYLGVPFLVKPSPADEESFVLSGTADRRAVESARIKALARAEADKDSWVLAADTVVCIGGRILGKPANRNEARDMLLLLSGKDHIVTTGVCLYHGQKESPAPIFEETRVWIAPLSKEQIGRYLDTGEPDDKAGAYGIQGFGGAFIPRIEGCYFNVMGLPLYRTACLLAEAGILGDSRGLAGREAETP